MRIRKWYFLLLPLMLSCQAHQADMGQQDQTVFFNTIDSLYRGGKFVIMKRLLDSIRPSISPYDTEGLFNFYKYHIEKQNDQEKRDLYADSLVDLFNTLEKQKGFHDYYFQALMIRGHEFFRSRQYGNALLSYYKGKSLLEKDSNKCNLRAYYSKIAQVYYSQKKYLKAARCFAESIKTPICETSPHNIFYTTQGDLNNAGFSYEKHGYLDSALYYYKLDIAFIDEAAEKGIVRKEDIANASIVAYDNLGGLHVKMGNYAAAERYLKKSISIPNGRAEQEPNIKNTAYIKLAELYSILGNTKKADSLLKISNGGTKDDPSYASSKTLWLRVKADNYYRENDLVSAHNALKSYINYRDSIDKSVEQLTEIDVDREFQTLQQASDLLKVKQESESNRIFLFTTLLFLFMLLIIVVLTGINWKQQRKKNRVIDQKNRELQNLLSHLEIANRNSLKLLQVMAHDLKNPLTGITILASMLLKEKRFHEYDTKLLTLIKETGDNTVNVINELLDTGLNDDVVVLHKENVEINALATQSIDLLRFKAAAKDQKMELSKTKDDLYVYVDREKIWRLFNNLIANAIKFSPNNTTIKLNITQQKADILISITDNGIGISQQDKDSVFDVFTPVKKFGTAGEKPYGLGLSISKKIVEQHQGEIWFEDNPEGGTVFFVRIPLDTA